MEIKGKLQIILPLTEGQGQKGPWKKQEFVIETMEQFPKKICMNVWGDKVDDFRRYKVGDVLTCSLDISSREYNGKWYTDIRAWKIQAGEGVSNSGGQNNYNNNDVPFADKEPGISMDNGINSGSNNWEGDLPF
jgi:hypothetical protein